MDAFLTETNEFLENQLQNKFENAIGYSPHAAVNYEESDEEVENESLVELDDTEAKDAIKKS